ncbi:hypothetical protein HDU96_000190 [Phlyctochytrium bullatum]|nr:hypothetical protein HDU96_000190 [Phlyctochytrium bullatum]
MLSLTGVILLTSTTSPSHPPTRTTYPLTLNLQPHDSIHALFLAIVRSLPVSSSPPTSTPRPGQPPKKRTVTVYKVADNALLTVNDPRWQHAGGDGLPRGVVLAKLEMESGRSLGDWFAGAVRDKQLLGRVHFVVVVVEDGVNRTVPKEDPRSIFRIPPPPLSAPPPQAYSRSRSQTPTARTPLSPHRINTPSLPAPMHLPTNPSSRSPGGPLPSPASSTHTHIPDLPMLKSPPTSAATSLPRTADAPPPHRLTRGRSKSQANLRTPAQPEASPATRPRAAAPAPAPFAYFAPAAAPAPTPLSPPPPYTLTAPSSPPLSPGVTAERGRAAETQRTPPPRGRSKSISTQRMPPPRGRSRSQVTRPLNVPGVGAGVAVAPSA